MSVETLAEQINEAAGAYRVGGLQELRGRLHGRRPRTSKIFTKATVFVDGKDKYAFHDGGRTELQFNIGVEEREDQHWLRHGVAFSFERSRTLPDPATLLPKVRRFNEWLRRSAAKLQGFKMWHWEGPTLSPDRSPGDLPESLVRPEVFVFLGVRVPEAEVDVRQILRDFDRLYPLYEHVESSTELGS